MSLSNFRSYQLAKELYAQCKPIQLRHGLRDQLIRAASSIVLNLAEGSAKPSDKERQRFASQSRSARISWAECSTS